MSTITFQKGSGFLVACADELVFDQQQGTTSDGYLKIEILKGPNLVAYSGKMAEGSHTVRELREHKGKYKFRKAVRFLEQRNNPDTTYMVGGFYSGSEDFQIAVIEKDASSISPHTYHCLGWGHELAEHVIQRYISGYGTDMEKRTMVRANVDAIEHARVAIVGEGRPSGKTQLVIVESSGHKREFSDNDAAFLTKLVRSLRRRTEGDLDVPFTSQDVDNFYRAIVDGNKNWDDVLLEFLKPIPTRRKDEILVKYFGDMAL